MSFHLRLSKSQTGEVCDEQRAMILDSFYDWWNVLFPVTPITCSSLSYS